MKTYSAWSKDRENILQSSSGGVFFELAKKMVDLGGQVAGVVMDGVRPKYVLSDDLEVVKQMRGSKYLPCNPLPIFRQVMNSNKAVLFVGLPCHIKRLKKICENPNIIFCDLRCHGVPYHHEYIDYLWGKGKGKRIKSIKFRDKKDGWLKSTCIVVTFEDGSTYRGNKKDDKFLREYLSYKNVQKQCISCSKRNTGDITLGDFWGVPECLQNEIGTSIVYINTKKGEQFFNSINTVIKKQVPPDAHIGGHKLCRVYKPLGCKVDKHKFAIINGEGVLNYGNMLMTENTITYLSNLLPDSSFVIDRVADIDTNLIYSRLSRATNNTNIEVRHATADRTHIKSLIVQYIKGIVNPWSVERVRMLEDCSTVLHLGGDTLANTYYTSTLLRRLFDTWCFKRAGKKVFILSHTIGPFSWWQIPIARFVLRKIDGIYCRDEKSYVYVNNKIKITKNVHLVADLGFLKVKRQDKEVNQYGLKKDSYVVLVPSSLTKFYSRGYGEYIEGLKKIVVHMQSFNKKIIIMPHTGDKKDKEMLKELEDMDVTIIKDTLMPYEARSILANSFFNVSQRMHGAISSLQAYVPTVCLSYSWKYSGVIAEGLGLPELVVEIDKNNYRTGIDEVCKRIDLVQNSRKRIIKKLKWVIPNARMDAIYQLMRGLK